MNDETPKRSSGPEVAKGVVWCVLLNFLHLGTAVLLLMAAGNYSDLFASISYCLIAGFGLLQLLYVIPIALSQKKRGHPDVAKEMLIGASLTFLTFLTFLPFLLNATCRGLMMTGKIRIFG